MGKPSSSTSGGAEEVEVVRRGEVGEVERGGERWRFMIGGGAASSEEDEEAEEGEEGGWEWVPWREWERQKLKKLAKVSSRGFKNPGSREGHVLEIFAIASVVDGLLEFLCLQKLEDEGDVVRVDEQLRQVFELEYV